MERSGKARDAGVYDDEAPARAGFAENGIEWDNS